MKNNLSKLIFIILILLVALVISVIYGVNVGVIHIGFAKIATMFYYSLFHVRTPEAVELLTSVPCSIVFDLRLPRVLMSLVCGGSLALGGVVMQALIRNPLADPYILGISSGAALGATASIILGAFSFFGIYGVSLGAFAGSIVVTFAVFAIAFAATGSRNTTKLILAGTAINAICGACTSMIVYMAKDVEGIRDATFWIMGSMGKVTWNTLPFSTGVFLVCLGYFLTKFRTLDASLLGDDMALIMGIKLENQRKLFLIIVSFMVSSVVASVGIVGFVGLVVPHVIRLIFGTNHLRLMPISVLSGAIYLLWCDVLARSLVANLEIPIGILTSLIGGPFFLYLMASKKYGFGDN